MSENMETNSDQTSEGSGRTSDRLRAMALAASHRFKNIWVEFGAVLSQVQAKEAWRDWGFDSFEMYCSKELHIRQKTAMKLTQSYGFLSRHEPSVAAAESRIPVRFLDSQDWNGGDADERGIWNGGDAVNDATSSAAGDSQKDAVPARRRMPPLETISVLAGAEERGVLKEEDYAELRERIWGDEGGSPNLARELSQRFGEPKPIRTVNLSVKRLASSARKLAEGILSCDDIPDEVKAHAQSLAAELEDLTQAASEGVREANAS